MAIFFSCQCGQDLRENESRAGGYTRCPACNLAVPIPSLHNANQAVGIEADLSALDTIPVLPVPPPPTYELRVVESSGPSPTSPEADSKKVYRLAALADENEANKVWKELERNEIRRVFSEAKREMTERRRHVTSWRLEAHWYQCLLYPLRAWVLVFFLSLGWATLFAFLAAVTADSREAALFMMNLPLLFFIFLLLGFTAACLQVTLAAAIAGQAGFVAWPGADLRWAIRGGAQVVVCFLAGPVVTAVIAFNFWLNSGDLAFVDWLILAELGLVTVGYWTLALLAVQEKGRFRDANPLAVISLVKRVGYRPPLAALLIAIVILLHGLVMVHALEEVHHGIGGWMLLNVCWGSQLFWILFLLRWLGVSRFHLQKEAQRRLDAEPV